MKWNTVCRAYPHKPCANEAGLWPWSNLLSFTSQVIQEFNIWQKPINSRCVQTKEWRTDKAPCRCGAVPGVLPRTVRGEEVSVTWQVERALTLHTSSWRECCAGSAWRANKECSATTTHWHIVSSRWWSWRKVQHNPLKQMHRCGSRENLVRRPWTTRLGLVKRGVGSDPDLNDTNVEVRLRSNIGEQWKYFYITTSRQPKRSAF